MSIQTIEKNYDAMVDEDEDFYGKMEEPVSESFSRPKHPAKDDDLETLICRYLGR